MGWGCIFGGCQAPRSAGHHGDVTCHLLETPKAQRWGEFFFFFLLQIAFESHFCCGQGTGKKWAFPLASKPHFNFSSSEKEEWRGIQADWIQRLKIKLTNHYNMIDSIALYLGPLPWSLGPLWAQDYERGIQDGDWEHFRSVGILAALAN